MTEAQIQSKIIIYLQEHGWFVIKLIQTNKNGIPDLLAIKDGRTVFIEVKRPGQKPRALQLYRIQEIEDAGCTAVVAHSVEDVTIL